MSEQSGPGRRELNKAEKRRRIEATARALFSEYGYSMVTTQEVARRAEVGTGTLFRYARSKGELLCMVANENYRACSPHDPDADPVTAICWLARPYLEALARQPENAVAYHRETMFGEPGPHRDEALEILAEVRRDIAAILARASGRPDDDAEVTEAAGTVFDVLYMEVLRQGTTGALGVAVEPAALRERLASHIGRVLRGVLPTLGAAEH